MEHNNYIQNTEWGFKARLKLITQEMRSMVGSLSLEIFLIKTDLEDVTFQKSSYANHFELHSCRKSRLL